MARKTDHQTRFRDPLRQTLRILYLDDVTAIGCPVAVLDRVTTLRDYTGAECWLADDVYKAWRDHFTDVVA